MNLSEKKSITSFAMSLFSFDKEFKDKKYYEVTIHNNTLCKPKKSMFYVGYFDYRIDKNFDYKIENSSTFDAKFASWELTDKSHRVYFFESKKQKHLFVYLNSRIDCFKLLNKIVFFNNGESLNRSKKVLHESTVKFAARKFHEPFVEKLVKFLEKENGCFSAKKPSIRKQMSKSENFEIKDFGILSLFIFSAESFKSQHELDVVLKIKNKQTNVKDVVSFKRFDQFDKLSSEKLIQKICFQIFPLDRVKETISLFQIPIKNYADVEHFEMCWEILNCTNLEKIAIKKTSFEKHLDSLRKYGFKIIDFGKRFQLLTLNVDPMQCINVDELKSIPLNSQLLSKLLKILSDNPRLISSISLTQYLKSEIPLYFISMQKDANKIEAEPFVLQIVNFRKYFKKATNALMKAADLGCRSEANKEIKPVWSKFADNMSKVLIDVMNIFYKKDFLETDFKKTLNFLRLVFRKFRLNLQERLPLYFYSLVSFFENEVHELFETILEKRKSFYFDLVRVCWTFFLEVLDTKSIVWLITQLFETSEKEKHIFVCDILFSQFCIIVFEKQAWIRDRIRSFSELHCSDLWSMFQTCARTYYESDFIERTQKFYAIYMSASNLNAVDSVYFRLQNYQNDFPFKTGFVDYLWRDIFSSERKIWRTFKEEFGRFGIQDAPEITEESARFFPIEIEIEYNLVVQNNGDPSDYKILAGIEETNLKKISFRKAEKIFIYYENYIDFSKRNGLKNLHFQIVVQENETVSSVISRNIDKFSLRIYDLVFFENHFFSKSLSNGSELTIFLNLQTNERFFKKDKMKLADHLAWSQKKQTFLLKQIKSTFRNFLPKTDFLNYSTVSKNKNREFFEFKVKNIGCFKGIQAENKANLYLSDFEHFSFKKAFVEQKFVMEDFRMPVFFNFLQEFLAQEESLPNIKLAQISSAISSFFSQHEIFLSEKFVEWCLLFSLKSGHKFKGNIVSCFIFLKRSVKNYETFDFSAEVSQMMLLNCLIWNDLSFQVVHKQGEILFLRDLLCSKKIKVTSKRNRLLLVNSFDLGNCLKIEFDENCTTMVKKTRVFTIKGGMNAFDIDQFNQVN